MKQINKNEGKTYPKTVVLNNIFLNIGPYSSLFCISGSFQISLIQQESRGENAVYDLQWTGKVRLRVFPPRWDQTAMSPPLSPTECLCRN